jgi:tetratricopeptide (TPR) repeat protein
MPRREQLEEMLKADPDDTFLHYALAMQCASEGDVPAALQRLQQVIERDADYVAAYFQKGQLLAEQGDIEQARQIVTCGITVARKVGDTHAEAEMTGFLEML